MSNHDQLHYGETLDQPLNDLVLCSDRLKRIGLAILRARPEAWRLPDFRRLRLIYADLSDARHQCDTLNLV